MRSGRMKEEAKLKQQQPLTAIAYERQREKKMERRTKKKQFRRLHVYLIFKAVCELFEV